MSGEIMRVFIQVKMQQNEQQTTRAAEVEVTNVRPSLYILIIMGVGLATIVPILSHVIAKLYSVITSSIRVQGNIQPTWRNPEVFQFNPECCPICLSVPSLPLATNCGHVFCGPCLRTVWRNSQEDRFAPYVLCPMCRAQLHEILPVNPQEVLFSSVMRPPPDPNNNNNNRSYFTLYDFVVLFNETYRHQYAGPQPQSSLKRLGRAIIRVLRHLNAISTETGYQHPVLSLVLSVIMPAIYMSEQNNIIANALPWGYVDDVLVIALCAMPLVNYMVAFYASRRRRPHE